MTFLNRNRVSPKGTVKEYRDEESGIFGGKQDVRKEGMGDPELASEKKTTDG